VKRDVGVGECWRCGGVKFKFKFILKWELEWRESEAEVHTTSPATEWQESVVHCYFEGIQDMLNAN
jgi:hypothetical protein